MLKGEVRCSKVGVRSARVSDEHPHRWGRDVMWLRKCRVRRAFRRTLPIRKRNLPGLWCVQKANAPYEFCAQSRLRGNPVRIAPAYLC